MDNVSWEEINERLERGMIDFGSRVVILDEAGIERFCSLQWVEEDGYDRPLLKINLKK